MAGGNVGVSHAHDIADMAGSYIFAPVNNRVIIGHALGSFGGNVAAVFDLGFGAIAIGF